MSVRLEVHGHVAVVTLDRPEAMNSIDPGMRAELLTAWQQVRDDERIRVAILTGAGEKAFCTGSDLKKTPPATDSFARQHYGGTTAAMTAGMEFDKPLLAAINGYAIGGGLELALACDIRIASSAAQFGLSEVKMGSIPGAGGTQRLPRAVGASDAMLMLLTGDRCDATEALRIGLVSRVYDPAQLLPQAMQIAERIAANAPLAVRAVKRLVRDAGEIPLARGLDAERLAFGLLYASEDRIEGRAAFAEKRAPKFRGA
ncbi:MAG: enoyl-CoA hydratase/isomerase family protein [Rhizobacter sp.]|nr:enoyl-CoA hydratase/isomerase family protein [Rhizobacter sp.]